MLAKRKREKELHTKVNILNTPFLVIVESPSKCSKIEKYLGFQYKCIASKGHIRELVKVSANGKFTPEFEIIKEKVSHVIWMKTIISSFLPENIYLGTDDDREGEGIAWHICRVCNLDLKETKRILFHEVTESALKSAIKSSCHIRMNIVHAQQARQILDRMIGFQISPTLSRLVQHDNSVFLSAGRCQTPTLRLIYDRHVENNGKHGKLQYKIQGSFFNSPSTVLASLNKEFVCDNDCINFLEKSKTFRHILKLKPPIEKEVFPPQPFNTSTLLQFISNTLHLSPRHIMDCCQSLYQEGHITYMRTDSKFYAKGFLSQINNFVSNEFGNEYVGELQQLENTDCNNPHEAIRVTNLQTRTVEHKDKKTSEIYKIILNRTMQSCMSSYKHKDTDLIIDAPDDTFYKSNIEIPLFLGWKRISMSMADMNTLREQTTAQAQYLEIINDKIVVFNHVECFLHMKDLDKYYTEASLIQKLESIGIGRPSTYSMLIDTIQERKYIKKENIEGETITRNEFKLLRDTMQIETKTITKTFGSSKNKLCITPLGIESVNILTSHFNELFDYDYTIKMEGDLDKLLEVEVDNSELWLCILQSCEETIKLCIDPLKRKIGKSYPIGETHELVFGKSGAMIKVNEDKSYKPLKSGIQIDFGKLESNQYILTDLIDNILDPCLGIFHGENVFLKTGPYGAYVSWGDKTVSIKTIHKTCELENITFEMIKDILENKESKLIEDAPMILRKLNDDMSVRNSKFGKYIFKKTDKMKKPKFINIKECPYDVLSEEISLVLKWVQTQK